MSRKHRPWLDAEQEHAPIFKVAHKRQPKAARKQSYESNADVQRWLAEQSLHEQDLNKPAFTPTFLAGQRDADWILSSLTAFYEQDLVTDVVHVVKSGKEATVYCCTADPRTGLAYAAAKVYRPRMFRSLRNDQVYRQGRTQRDIDGRVVRAGSHQQRAFKSERGRATQVSSWIEYEYQTHCLLYESGADVPQPLAHIGNAVLMEYIGTLGEPAPLLYQVDLAQEEAAPLLERILSTIEHFFAHNRIHGDLSAYNILYWKGDVKIIDFAQAVDPSQSDGSFALLERDIERVGRYFARYGMTVDAHALARNLWQKYRGAF
ncbi:MAG TPA: RIO1 family regulatory kinase/ATPase [Ktedonobacteraceae bacterium]|nr:RIO1 family regulatory kinase/ATPase [Ktedonobacteraceae bacterium]